MVEVVPRMVADGSFGSVRRCAYTYTHADTNTNTNSDANTDTDACFADGE